MSYDPHVELDPILLNTWGRMSIAELEELRSSIGNRIDRIQQYSESIHESTEDSINKLDRYLMYRKGKSPDSQDNNDIIL